MAAREAPDARATVGPVGAVGPSLRGRKVVLRVLLVGVCGAAGLVLPACRRAPLPPRPAGSPVVVAADAPEDAGAVTLEEAEPNDLLATAQRIDLSQAPAVVVNARLVAPPGARARDVDLFRVVIPPPPVIVEGAEGPAAAPEAAGGASSGQPPAPPSPPPPVPPSAAAPPLPAGSSSPMRQLLSIEVAPDPHLAIAVEALDDQGRILISATGAAPGEPERIPNLAVAPGAYFLRVKPLGGLPSESPFGGSKGRRHAGAADAAGAAAASAPPSHGPAESAGYRLSVRLRPFEKGDETEPNGSGALANEVQPGADVAGFLGWRHDEDWFRLPLSGLPEGSALSIDLDPIEGVAPTVAVYDSVEQKMTEQKGRKGDRVAIRNVRLPSSDPCVFVVVKAEAGRNPEVRYTLHLRSEEARADAELEPNDDPVHAVPLGDGTFLGYLGPGDVDVYRYTAPMPVELNFEATPPEHVDLKVELLREDGTVLARIDAGRRREPERLPNVYVEGSALLRLSAGKGDGNVDEPYRIVASSRPVEAGAEREPNNLPTLATALDPEQVGSGLIFPRGDTDFWRLHAAAKPGEQLAVAVRGIVGMTLEVRVASAGGKEWLRFRAGGIASAPVRLPPVVPVLGQAQDQARDQVRENEGCCLVQVREATGRLANPRDRYTLSVMSVTP